MRGSGWTGGRGLPALFLLLALIAPIGAGTVRGQQSDASGWIEVRYAQLVDRRQLSHSGDSVGELLRMLEGRPLPPPGQRPADRLNHVLLDPLVEPYAFVLQDLLDSSAPVPNPPMIEVGQLWRPGGREPAWAELLRARRYLAESDGRGRMRISLPAVEPFAAGNSGEAVRRAVADAWPVLRHLFAAESRRLQAETLQVRFHVYRHFPARSVFLLGAQALDLEVDDTRAAGRRPPLDLEAIQQFLAGGLRLEGARLEQDGSLKLIGSPTGEAPSLLGRPLALSDFAVAYRAVFHGGLAEPYMSLDRGPSPQTAKVNYGGRLRDTALGMVSLLCDIRFKTFSLGLGIAEGRDLRGMIRGELPAFRSHLERFAAHPGSQEVMGQQTRLWFYPDKVDLTVSPQGDAMLLRKVRMSAASERIESGAAAAGQDPPWTRATVNAINRDYETLARFFPELGDLDRVVRLLSLFTWLKQVESEGLLVPELDVLLALELPEFPTPRTYPQLLAFNALPPPGGEGDVVTLDRVPTAEALERLSPLSGDLLPPRQRLTRALAALDRSNPRNASLIEEIGGLPLDRMQADGIDRLAHRAERLRMHQTVLATLEPDKREGLAARQQAGEQLRVFSVGIGGLDLGMGQVVARASGRSMTLGGGGPRVASIQARPTEGSGGGRGTLPAVVREEWRTDPGLLPRLFLPEHGPGAGFIEREVVEERASIRMLLGADSPEPVSRRMLLDEQGRARQFERTERGRSWRYSFELQDGAWSATLAEGRAPSPVATTWRSAAGMPPGAALLQLVTLGAPQEGVLSKLGLRLTGPAIDGARKLETAYPRASLQRLVMGPAADLQPGRPLPGLDPLPEGLGQIRTLIVALEPAQMAPPWEASRTVVAGEENPARLARALNGWWSREVGSGPPRAAVAGTDPASSLARWSSAPHAGQSSLLLLPEGAFPGRLGELRGAFREAWGSAKVVDTLPSTVESELVLLVSGESPGRLAIRLRGLAGSAAMQGKLLAVWSLSGQVREDLPASLLADGRLAGFGLAESGVMSRREAVSAVAAFSRSLAGARATSRVEELSAKILWYF
jgi:hypothetical protein